MDVDEDDDFYGDGSVSEQTEEKPRTEDVQITEANPEVKEDDEDLEEGEEEDSDDSDIDIITERKDGTVAPAPGQARYNQAPPSRTPATDTAAAKPAAEKKENLSKATPKSELPGLTPSKVDVNDIPIYPPAKKPITQVNIDEDLTGNDKPWRRPGADITDWFNYGFDEFTWALYAAKQEAMKKENDGDKMVQNMNMMMMGGMPGMPGGAGAGMEGMPPEMQQMMQQMMAQGMDPSQMDPSAMFGGAQAGQAFGGQGGFGQGQGQGQGFGYDQGGGNRGGYGRGRGGRGRW